MSAQSQFHASYTITITLVAQNRLWIYCSPATRRSFSSALPPQAVQALSHSRDKGLTRRPMKNVPGLSHTDGKWQSGPPSLALPAQRG